ncbi:hypothetical protein M3699_06785 [Peribacillus simplex]|uniref:hypothetical protein n=1 Tax=Peribacillus simplex TaxID=1478 RepID=UPI0020403F2D|nr:hypothetical protein [Peribacillus simplex]MCM3673594.1 hypothetical protein [Peribacillus simplex]
MKEFFSLPTDRRKKEYTLEVMQKPLEQVAKELNCDIGLFKDIHQKIINLDFENKWIYAKKSSPNRKYSCSIVCEQEVLYRRERIMREIDTDEQRIFRKLGKIGWTHNHKVSFSDPDYKTKFIVTFLERNSSGSLYWKCEQQIFQ